MSILDKVSAAISPVIRKGSDLNITLLGTKTQVMRIIASSANSFAEQPFDVFGDSEYALESSTATIAGVTVMIRYPFGDVEIFGDKETGGAQVESDIDAIDIMDVLPIEMVIRFDGDYETDPVILEKNDLILDVKWDENQNKIPILMQITKMRGSFFEKNLIQKKAELAIYYGQVEPDIQAKIDEYIASLG